MGGDGAGLPQAVSERETWEALPSRQDSFLLQYVYHSYFRVPSPVGYAAAVGLCLLAASAPVGFVVPDVFVDTTFPNFYALLVGPSGGYKTIGIRVGMRLLAEVAVERIARDPASEEAFWMQLQRQPVQLAVYPEYEAVLANTAGGATNYRAKLRAAWTDVFDCFPKTRERVKGALIKVDTPRFSLLGGCTPRHLEDQTTLLDWEGGFIARHYLIYSSPEREMPRVGTPDSHRRQWLKGWLEDTIKQRANATLGACRGLTPGAAEMWDAWVVQVKSGLSEVPSRIHGSISRVPMMAAKIAVLLAWDYGGARQGGDWWLTEDVITPAIRLAELHRRSVLALVERIAPDAYLRDRQRVRNALRVDEWLPLGVLLAKAEMGRKRVLGHLTDLATMGLVETCTQGGEPFWRLVEDPIVPVWDDDLGPDRAPPSSHDAVVVPFPKGG